MLIDEAKLITAFDDVDADVCADYGDYSEYGYSQSCVRKALNIAKHISLPKQECYIVLYQNYTEDRDTHVYWSLEDARKAVDDELRTADDMLRDEGYEPEVLSRGGDHSEIYVPDRSIYYEWDIILSTIE